MRWRIPLVGVIRYNKHLKKGNKMATTLEVGKTFTTTKSGIVGIIKEIHPQDNGVNRLLLDVNGTERWTSVSN